jgi:flavin reductase (DIM6/NTAB) family NADH-FMN oxidoreductase RutF
MRRLEETMERQSLAPGSCYFYYPRLVAVVGVRDDARATVNFTPVAWSSPLSSDPPLYGVCLSPRSYSHHLVLKTGEFPVNFLTHHDATLAAALGRRSGRQVDKVKALSLALDPSEVVRTPSLARAYASVECVLLERHQLGDQTLFVADVQLIHAAVDGFDGDGVMRVDRVSPLLYLGGARYVSTAPASVVTPEVEA